MNGNKLDVFLSNLLTINMSDNTMIYLLIDIYRMPDFI